jgi:hypothetical protein
VEPREEPRRGFRGDEGSDHFAEIIADGGELLAAGLAPLEVRGDPRREVRGELAVEEARELDPHPAAGVARRG